jgi:pimeloyl-ACP methyl ester carboxylesterase
MLTKAEGKTTQTENSSITEPLLADNDRKVARGTRTFVKMLGGFGTVLMAIVGGIVILLTEPYLPMFLGILLVGGAIFLAYQLFQPLAWTLLTLMLLVVAVIAFSQLTVSTPPIVDAQGKVVPSSIASLEKVKIGGVDQWVLIRGKSVNNPVLLFLSGGPGGTELGWFRQINADLENDFVVVIWEQRGAGKSYSASPYAEITVDRLVEDGVELSQLLMKRFQEQKIYLVGHSWGTILGVKMVQRAPSLFYAYVGTGQMVNTTENDLITYDWTIAKARQQGDTKALEDITRYGPPPYNGLLAGWQYVSYLSRGLAYEEEEIGLPEKIVPNGMEVSEFGLLDKLYYWRGLLEGLNEIYVKELRDLDFETQATKLDVPVYLMIGRHDYNSNWVLAERWFNQLQAPQKELIWFANSGHSPCYYEPTRFNTLLVTKVRAETYKPS